MHASSVFNVPCVPRVSFMFHACLERLSCVCVDCASCSCLKRQPALGDQHMLTACACAFNCCAGA
eukprot:351829-Chlamydomonas_euryale.AAC.8